MINNSSFQIRIEEDGMVRNIAMSTRSFIIGREDNIDLPVNDGSVSRQHVHVFTENGKIYLKDLGSSNGTFVQGRRLEPGKDFEYNQGDQIILGKKGLALWIELIESGSAPKPKPSMTPPAPQSEFDDELTPPPQSESAIAPPPPIVSKTDIDDKTAKIDTSAPRAPGEPVPPNIPLPVNDQDGVSLPGNDDSEVSAFGKSQNEKSASLRFAKVEVQKPKKMNLEEVINEEFDNIGGFREPDDALKDIRKRARMEARRLIEEAKEEAHRIHSNYKDQMNEERKKFRDFAKELKEQIRQEEKKMLDEAEAKVLTLEKAAVEEGKDILVRNLQELEEIRDKSVEEVEGLKRTLEDWLGGFGYDLKEELKTDKESPVQFLEELRNKVKFLLNELQSLQEDVLLLRSNKHKLTQENDETQKIMAETKARREQLHQEVSSLRSELQQLKTSRENEKDYLVDELADLRTERGSLSQALESLKKQGKIQEHDLQFQAERLEKLEVQIREKEKEYKNIERDVVRVTEEVINRQRQAEEELQLRNTEVIQKMASELKSVQDQAQKIRNEAESYALEIKKNADKYSIEVRKKADAFEEKFKRSAEKEAEKIRNDAHAEMKARGARLERDLKERRTEIESSIERRRQEMELELQQRRESAERDIEYLEEKVKSEIGAARKKAAVRISRIRRKLVEKRVAFNLNHEKTLREARARAEEILDEARETAERETQELRAEFDEYKRKQQRALSQQVDETEDKVKALMESANEESKKMVNEAEEDAEAIRNSAIVYKDKLVEKAESEYLEQKEQHRMEFAEEKVKQIEELKKMREEALQKEEDRKKYEIQEFKTNFRVHLVQAYRRHAKDADDAVIDKLEKDIDNIVVRVFNTEEHDFKERLGSILKIDSVAQENVTLFWKRAGYVAASFLAVFLLMASFPNQVKKLKRGIASIFMTEKSASDMFVEKTQEHRRKKYELNLDMQPGYFNTYSDNVLYSTNFVETYEDRTIQQEWILALNDFFGRNLEVGDDAVVQFVSKESSLISELKSQRNEINPQFIDKGISRMKASEKEFEDHAKSLLKSEANYKKFKAFQRDFFREKLQ